VLENVTKTFGRHLINSGHEMIASNSRGPETLTGLAQKVSALPKAAMSLRSAPVHNSASSTASAPSAVLHRRRYLSTPPTSVRFL